MTEPAEPSPAPSPSDRGDWRPPKRRESNVPSIVIGVTFVVIGVWYLLDQTLGLQMPRINWRDIWPIFLIVIGGIMLYRSTRRRT
jgi:hypothetical protein